MTPDTQSSRLLHTKELSLRRLNLLKESGSGPICKRESRSIQSARTAWDGVSALLEMETGLPDLLVSNLQMPRMSGFELLSTIRLQFPAIPLIAQ